MTPVDDGFERHYAEKIWALIPEVYRDADHRATVPGQLRAFVELLAQQAAIARRSVDRLWADTRADEADDWAISYIGSLIGARPVNALNRAGQRANLARTIQYRRRQGTAKLAEQLADDIADWDAVVQEGFRRLFRLWHRLDDGPAPGPITRSPQGGYPDLRSMRIGDIVDTAHDDLAHRPDVRRHREFVGRHGFVGKYGIAKMNLHLFRSYALPLNGVTPRRLRDDLFTIDPSGRDVPLFQVGGQSTPTSLVADEQAAVQNCRPKREWEMRAPLTCRRLNFGAFEPRREIAPIDNVDDLAPIYGRRFETEAELLEATKAALAQNGVVPPELSPNETAALIAGALVDDSPRRNLLPGGNSDRMSIELEIEGLGAGPLGPERLYGANLEQWGSAHKVEDWVRARVDPDRGRVRLTQPLDANEQLRVGMAYYGAFHPVGAGTHERTTRLAPTGFTPIFGSTPDWQSSLQGDLRILDSRTVQPILRPDGVIEVDDNLTLGAADGARPYMVLAASDSNEVVFQAMQPGLELLIDGLWLAVESRDPTGAAIVLEGEWSRVTLHNVTLDPGGLRAAPPGEGPETIPAVTLALQGTVAELIVARSVTGPVVERTSATDPCSSDVVVLRDSITQAIDIINGRLIIDRTTVLGDMKAGCLDASHLLVDGVVGVENRQEGCFRFSAAHEGSLVANAYQSTFFAGGLPPGTFISTSFGNPTFGQLAPTAAPELRRGGEHGTEIGVYNRALDPIEADDLKAKLDEHTPINVIAQSVFVT